MKGSSGVSYSAFLKLTVVSFVWEKGIHIIVGEKIV